MEMMLYLAQVHRSLKLYSAASVDLEEGEAIAVALFGRRHPIFARVRLHRALVAADRNDFDGALRLRARPSQLSARWLVRAEASTSRCAAS